MQSTTQEVKSTDGCTPFENTLVEFEKTHLFSSTFLDYLGQKPELDSFYHRFPTLNHFGAQMEDKSASFSQESREILVKSLLEQYHSIKDAPTAQIDSLKDGKTFTVTTGHQLNIFSGPLYFIYKIVSTINLARKLQEAYPDCHFVPVYWMATEDHDFDEISHFNLFGKKYQWEKEAKGAVGHLSTQGLDAIMEEVGEMPAFFQEAYQAGNTLAQATRQYVHHLFGSYGLVVVDADHISLKRALQPAMRADLFEQAHKGAVEQADRKLEELGYKAQVFVREINFFYLDKEVRERVEWNGEQFEVLNTDLRFSKEEMEELIENHPQKLSPNVILRPLYQELILPNLAYLGGPSEVVYWLQLKGVFDLHKVTFPMLMPRNFALVVHGGNAKKFHKVGLSPKELFLEEHELRKHFVEQETNGEVHLNEELEKLAAVFAMIESKAEEVDPSLKGFVGAEHKKALKSFQNIEKRLQKAEEKKQDTRIRQMQQLKERLFPNNTPQERVDNFLNIYLNDPEFIDRLLLAFDPLDYRMNVLLS